MKKALPLLLAFTLTAAAQDAWTDRTASVPGASTQLVDVAWSPEVYMLIGQNAYYVGETGLTDWQAFTPPNGSVLNSIAAVEGDFVIAGNAGALYAMKPFSPHSWYSITSPAGTADHLCAQHFSGRFIVGCTPSAGQETQLVQKIGNGDWERVAFPATATGGVAHSIRDIAFKPGLTEGTGLWVFGTNTAGTVLTAPEDFSSITAITVTGLGIDQRVTFGAGRFVMVADGDDGQIWTSTDGSSWTQATLPIVTPDLTGVHFDGETWVVVGSTETDSNPARPAILRSTDGLTWTAANTVPTSTRNLQFVQKYDGLWITGGSAKTLFTGGRSTYSQAEITVITQGEANYFTDGGSGLNLTPPQIIGATPRLVNFSIYNEVSTEALSGISVSLSGADAAAFSVLNLSSTTVDTSLPVTFQLRFQPTTPGTYNAKLQITSNDNDESPFDIPLTGTAVAPTAPQVTQQPEDALILAGLETYTLSSSADGLNLSASARKGTAGVSATTQTAPAGSISYAYSQQLPSAAGTYQARFTNAQGTTDSRAAYVGVITFPSREIQVPQGRSFTLTCPVTLPAGATATYRWLMDDDENNELADSVPGATGMTFSGTGTRTLTVRNFNSTSTPVPVKPGDVARPTFSTFACRVTMTTPASTGSRQVSKETPAVTASMITPPIVRSDWSLDNTWVATPVNEPIPTQFSPSVVPTRFSASGLPSGMVLNSSTGVITGQARAPKIVSGAVVPYRIKFTITNAAGTVAVERDWLVQAMLPELTGLFSGVVEREWSINGGMGGIFSLSVLPTGAVSGSVTLAGVKTSVTGYGVSSNDGMNFRFDGLFKRSPSTWAPLNFTFTSQSNRCDGSLRDLSWARYWNPSVYAGASDGAAGYADGAGGTARFAYPMSAAPAPGGSSLWIVDRDNHCIRSLTENGVAATVLGSPGVAGFAQGSAANLRLNAPTDIELLSNGDYLILDSGNHALLRYTTSNGETQLLAGTGSAGAVNGPVASASFDSPRGIAVDPAGNIYVTESRTIRKITPTGVVSTLAGRADSAGLVNGSATAARFDDLRDLCYEPVSKTLLACDQGGAVIRRVTLTGTTSTHSGARGIMTEASGGTYANTRYQNATDLVPDGAGGFYVVGARQMHHVRSNGLARVTPISQGSSSSLTGVCFLGPDLWVMDGGLNQIVFLNSDSSPGTYADIYCWRTPYTSSNPVPTGYAAYRTALLRATSVQPGMTVPMGAGALAFTTTTTGLTTWSGRTPDGISTLGSRAMGERGDLAFHHMLHSNRASLQCQLRIDPTESLSLTSFEDDPPADAFKISLGSAVARGTNYHDGWSYHELTVTGAVYQKTPSALLSQADVRPAAENVNWDILTPHSIPDVALFSVTGTLVESGVMTVNSATNSNSFSARFTPATGIFTGSYKLPASGPDAARTATVYGIIVPGLGTAGHHRLPRATSAVGAPAIDSGLIQIGAK